MQKIILSGCNGRMGRTIERLAAADADLEIVAGFDINTEAVRTYPIFSNPADYTGSADVVIDFSNSQFLSPLLTFCISARVPLVLCTTGFSAEQLQEIRNASQFIPIFRSANMSMGINLLLDLIRKSVSVLGTDYDVEIVERHHRTKVDAPSGTALMLADAAAAALPYQPDYVYNRQDRRQPRGKHEIGISAVRGGTIVGEHEVIFAGQDEVIELRHTAYSRDVFAVGALRAAKYMAGISLPGMYDMTDVLADR